MASRIDVVRISHDELRQLADKLDTSHQRDPIDRQMDDQLTSKQRREQKRPPIALYRPGVSRLSRRTSPGNYVDQSEESSSGSEISPPKSVRPFTSLVVERSNQNAVTTGASNSSNSKASGNDVQTNSKRTDKSHLKEARPAESTGIRHTDQKVSISDEWDEDAPAQPVNAIKQVSGTSRVTVHPDDRKKNQQGGKMGQHNEQSKMDTRGKVHREPNTTGKTSMKETSPQIQKEKRKADSIQHSKPRDKHNDSHARGTSQRDQLKTQAGRNTAAANPTHHDQRSRDQQGKRKSRRKEPPDKRDKGSTNRTELPDKTVGEMDTEAKVHHGAKPKEQDVTTSMKQGKQVSNDAKRNARTEQLKVNTSGKVNEPAEISPTTVELIKNWKGDQAVVVIPKRSHQEITPSKTTTTDGSVSISRGKGPLRNEDKTGLNPINSSNPQSHVMNLTDAQSEVKVAANAYVPGGLPVNTPGLPVNNTPVEQQSQQSAEKNVKERNVNDNAAEWDWVKELMSEKTPADTEPVYIQGNGDNCESAMDSNTSSQLTGTNFDQHAHDENKDVVSIQAISTHQEAKKETISFGGTQSHPSKEEQHYVVGDDKQRVVGGYSEAKGEREEGDWRTDQVEETQSKSIRANAVVSHSKQESKGHSTDRMESSSRASRKTRDKKEDSQSKHTENAHNEDRRHHERLSDVKHQERQHEDFHSKKSGRQQDSHGRQRPERAIYVAPKKTSRTKSDQRHDSNEQGHHYEYTGKVDDTFKDDEQGDSETGSREVEVSPDRTDIIITVKNQPKKKMHKQDSGRGAKRYSSHRSRHRETSESSTGSETHLHDVSVPDERDFVKETQGKLKKLHIERFPSENRSLQESAQSEDSDRERLSKGASKQARHKYDHDESDDMPIERKHTQDIQKTAGRAESDRVHKQSRNESTKSKHSVQFSKEVYERGQSSGESGSDSDGYSRTRNRSYKSRSDHRDRDGDQEIDSRRHPRDSESRRQPRDSRRQVNDGHEHHAKGGGLLRLPGNVQVESAPRNVPPRSDTPPSDQGAYSPYYDKHYPAQGQSSPADGRHMHHHPVRKPSTAADVRHKQDRSRGTDRSRLWDPNKPQQHPALPDKHNETDELQFYDPDEEQSDQQANTPDQRNSYPYPYPQGYAPPQGYYPGYPAVPQNYYSQGYYPPQQQQPLHPSQSASWAEQVEAQRLPRTPPPGAYPAPAGPSYRHFPPLSAAVASDPYQLSTNQDIQGGASSHQSVHHQSAMRLLREASAMELELTNLIQRGLRGDQCIDRAISIQHDLEKVCEKVLLLDLDACNKYNMEQLLWKSAYYQLIEALRKQQDPIGVNKDYLIKLLDHGNEFYQGLLSKLESNYKFNLENYTGMDPLRDEKRRSVKLALLSAQRCMIALGDIARYKELANETSNYGKARSWYLKAQQLVPRNGRPYNQLAILALYTRRKLDSVYYYMRSLAASNQFLTARESLMSLFEEVRKKSQHKEQEELRVKWEKEQAKTIARRNKARKFLRRHGEDQWREEVWVSHDGVRSDAEGSIQEAEEESDEAKLKKLSPVEVNKKFVLSFLNAHGKIFTNIGMDVFPHVVDKLLKEFYVLLTHSPSPISSTRLLQLMAINMYAAHHTAQQEPEADNMRSLQQEQAVQLGLDMFGLLVERCTKLFKEHITQHPSQTHLLNEDIHEFLPGIKIYADWMMCHMALWNPPPNCTEIPYSAAMDVWKVLASFFNVIDSINTSAVSFIKQQPEDCIEIRLPEDLALSGFVPLMTLPLQPVYVPEGTDKIVAMDCTRINSLRFFAEFLCGLEMPLLAYRKSKGGFFSVAPEYIHADPEADVVEEMNDDDDVIIEDYLEEDDDGESTEADRDINRLRERKVDLERKLKQQQRKKAHREAIMDSHRQQRKMEIEIQPVYLIADTNCFIDHVTVIQMLVSCKRYTLVVPLVVINELDGLAKGSREGQYSDPVHAYQVQSCAASAMRYLEDQFELGNKHIRALTAKGTVMDTIIFRSEESSNKGNNDDLILKCCLHYCEDKARDFMPHNKDAPVHLLREVVLLTNDRNLRVKALNQNVPVKDIISFVKWAKL